MICVLGNESFIHFKCNMGHIQLMFHIYYTEFVAYKSWKNILIVLCVMPPWLWGKALDNKVSLFWSLEGPWFKSWSHQCPSQQSILLTQGPIHEIFEKKYRKLAKLENDLFFLSRLFWIFFFKFFFFLLHPNKKKSQIM